MPRVVLTGMTVIVAGFQVLATGCLLRILEDALPEAGAHSSTRAFGGDPDRRA
jgi:hypothetical protein